MSNKACPNEHKMLNWARDTHKITFPSKITENITFPAIDTLSLLKKVYFPQRLGGNFSTANKGDSKANKTTKEKERKRRARPAKKKFKKA